MIKKDGKFYVVVEFSSDFMAVGFEQCVEQQKGVIVDHMGTVLPARHTDDAFASEDEVNAIDSIDRVAGKRVQ